MATRSVHPMLLNKLPSSFRRLISTAPSSISAVPAFNLNPETSASKQGFQQDFLDGFDLEADQIFDHFCAGKGLKEVGGTVKKLWDSGLRAMLDYGLEHAIDNEDCDRNLEQFIQTAGSAKSQSDSSVKCGSWNVGKFAASKAIDLGLEKDSQNLQFGQLYGMADTLSFGLRNAGFRVSKYLPFGPIEQIMPYLLRRAEENRALLSTSCLDNQLMRKELFRRLTPRFS
ncbi:uncharacterized protein [Primulina eburnea]|uniref:uncharacterized protein n=1 Tax=Primulina eburnea TaxID=1245227 RepID=UPI003C6CB2FB